jgi:UDP-glucuronate 4-epimerase
MSGIAVAPLRRALVTGCAGFLGSHLSERLLDDGVEVVGVDCFTDYYPRALKEANLVRLRDERRFTLCALDLSNDGLDGLVADVDAIFHLAAQPGVRGSFGATFATYVRHNVHATQRLLEATARCDPMPTFVYASSSSIYGTAKCFPTPETTPPRPVSPYGVTKVATEQLAGAYHRSHGVPAVGLRYFTAYGPRQRPDMAFAQFARRALEGQPLSLLGSGRQVRDFTYVDDVVTATVAAARRRAPGPVYNVGGGAPVPLRDTIDLLGELLGRRLRIEHRKAVRGDARVTCADCSLAARELGFMAKMPLRDGLARQLQWLLETRPAPRIVALTGGDALDRQRAARARRTGARGPGAVGQGRGADGAVPHAVRDVRPQRDPRA